MSRYRDLKLALTRRVHANAHSPSRWNKSGLAFVYIGLFLVGMANADPLDTAIAASRSLSLGPIVPRADLVHASGVVRATLSPNAKYLAYGVLRKGKLSVSVFDIETNTHRKLFTTKRLKQMSWSGNSRYLFLETDGGVAVSDIIGNGRPSQILNLDPSEDQFYYGVDTGSPQHGFISMYDPTSSQHVLYRVDQRGTKEQLYRSTQRIYNFLAPDGGPIRFVRKVHGLSNQFDRIINGKEEHLFDCDYSQRCRLESYSAATDSLYLTDRVAQNLTGLTMIRNGTRRVLHTDPEGSYDIARVVFNQRSSEPMLVEYETDFHASYGLKDIARHHLAVIQGIIKSRILRIETSAISDLWLVTDEDPTRLQPRYLLYDTHARQVSQPLRSVEEELTSPNAYFSSGSLALRTPVWWEASDGMRLQGYVTIPRGVDVATAPLVVVVHGGPWTRVRGQLSTFAQFLATRGYAVFEPNFRASTGFGQKYESAAKRDFGRGRVHQDIMEGMRYLLTRGIGEQQRLAIVGHSFGGFSTLGALAFEPDTFRVGVATAPPPALSDAVRHYFDSDSKDAAGFSRLQVMARLAVDINDKEDVRRSDHQSPRYFSDKIKSPLYVWAGEKDDRVNILDVRSYMLKLETMGKGATFLSAPGAGHVPQGELETEAFIYLSEAALHQHLGGRIESALSPRLQRYLDRNLVMGKLYRPKPAPAQRPLPKTESLARIIHEGR